MRDCGRLGGCCVIPAGGVWGERIMGTCEVAESLILGGILRPRVGWECEKEGKRERNTRLGES